MKHKDGKIRRLGDRSILLYGTLTANCYKRTPTLDVISKLRPLQCCQQKSHVAKETKSQTAKFRVLEAMLREGTIFWGTQTFIIWCTSAMRSHGSITSAILPAVSSANNKIWNFRVCGLQGRLKVNATFILWHNLMTPLTHRQYQYRSDIFITPALHVREKQ